MQNEIASNFEDQQRIDSFFQRLNSHENSAIVEAYNNEKRIVGVRAQNLYLIALNKIFINRFQKSPIHVISDGIVSLTGPIYYLEQLDTFDWFNKN